MSLQPPHSLRTRLLWFLLAAITLTALVQAVIAYRTARSEADEIFDYHMQQMAMSLRSGLPLAGSGQDGDDRHDEEGYDFVVQVWTSDGLRAFQSARAALGDRRDLSPAQELHDHISELGRSFHLRQVSGVCEAGQCGM